jgi:hypothetical protein
MVGVVVIAQVGEGAGEGGSRSAAVGVASTRRAGPNPLRAGHCPSGPGICPSLSCLLRHHGRHCWGVDLWAYQAQAHRASSHPCMHVWDDASQALAQIQRFTRRGSRGWGGKERGAGEAHAHTRACVSAPQQSHAPALDLCVSCAHHLNQRTREVRARCDCHRPAAWPQGHCWQLIPHLLWSTAPPVSHLGPGGAQPKLRLIVAAPCRCTQHTTEQQATSKAASGGI